MSKPNEIHVSSFCVCCLIVLVSENDGRELHGSISLGRNRIAFLVRRQSLIILLAFIDPRDLH